ncbi:MULTISPECIES: hypothetical protein [unclassified Nocardia]|nr:hypothetical protein OHA42_14820 [Nocardia sp. NBC_01009]
MSEKTKSVLVLGDTGKTGSRDVDRRPPRDFTDYADTAAATGIWQDSAQ